MSTTHASVVRMTLRGLVLVTAAALAACSTGETPPAVSTTTITSANIASRDIDVHVSPDIASRCGTSTLHGIALCLTRGPLRAEKVEAVGRIVEGDGAELRGEHALARAERVKRFLLDDGVPPGRVRSSAGITGSVAARQPNRVDLVLAP